MLEKSYHRLVNISEVIQFHPLFDKSDLKLRNVLTMIWQLLNVMKSFVITNKVSHLKSKKLKQIKDSSNLCRWLLINHLK